MGPSLTSSKPCEAGKHLPIRPHGEVIPGCTWLRRPARGATCARRRYRLSRQTATHAHRDLLVRYRCGRRTPGRRRLWYGPRAAPARPALTSRVKHLSSAPACAILPPPPPLQPPQVQRPPPPPPRKIIGRGVGGRRRRGVGGVGSSIIIVNHLERGRAVVAWFGCGRRLGARGP